MIAINHTSSYMGPASASGMAAPIENQKDLSSYEIQF